MGSPQIHRVFRGSSVSSPVQALGLWGSCRSSFVPRGLQWSSGSSPVHWVSEGPLALHLSTGLRGSHKMLEGLNRVSQGPPGHRLPTGSSRVHQVSGVFWVSQGPPHLQGSARLLRVYWVSEGPAPPGSVESTGSGPSVHDVTSSSRCPPRDFVLLAVPHVTSSSLLSPTWLRPPAVPHVTSSSRCPPRDFVLLAVPHVTSSSALSPTWLRCPRCPPTWLRPPAVPNVTSASSLSPTWLRCPRCSPTWLSPPAVPNLTSASSLSPTWLRPPRCPPRDYVLPLSPHPHLPRDFVLPLSPTWPRPASRDFVLPLSPRDFALLAVTTRLRPPAVPHVPWFHPSAWMIAAPSARRWPVTRTNQGVDRMLIHLLSNSFHPYFTPPPPRPSPRPAFPLRYSFTDVACRLSFFVLFFLLQI